MGGVLNQIDASLGETSCLEACPQSLGNGVGAAPGIFSAAENADVAAFQTQSCCIAGDVGAALVNDGYHPHGDGGLLDDHAVAVDGLFSNLSRGIRQLNQRQYTVCHGLDALFCQQETVHHHGGDASFRLL